MASLATQKNVSRADLIVIGGNAMGAKNGVFTNAPGILTNDYFVNLLDMGTAWSESEAEEAAFEDRDPFTGEVEDKSVNNLVPA